MSHCLICQHSLSCRTCPWQPLRHSYIKSEPSISSYLKIIFLHLVSHSTNICPVLVISQALWLFLSGKNHQAAMVCTRAANCSLKGDVPGTGSPCLVWTEFLKLRANIWKCANLHQNTPRLSASFEKSKPLATQGSHSHVEIIDWGWSGAWALPLPICFPNPTPTLTYTPVCTYSSQRLTDPLTLEGSKVGVWIPPCSI